MCVKTTFPHAASEKLCTSHLFGSICCLQECLFMGFNVEKNKNPKGPVYNREIDGLALNGTESTSVRFRSVKIKKKPFIHKSVFIAFNFRQHGVYRNVFSQEQKVSGKVPMSQYQSDISFLLLVSGIIIPLTFTF